MTTPTFEESRLSSVNKYLTSGVTRNILFVLGILFVMIGASFFTTVVYSHGDLPSGKYRLHVRNPAGKSVEGAILNAYVDNSNTPVKGYFLPNDLFVSDAQGLLEFVKDPEQGSAQDIGWKLLWIFPITPAVDNKVNLEITAQGYEPLRFTEADLFKSVLNSYGHTPKTKAQTYNGVEVDVNLYELDFTLHEKN